MRCVLWTGVLLASILGTACASRAPRAAATPVQDGFPGLDTGYIGQVERKARQRGLHVQWVNPPRRRDGKP